MVEVTKADREAAVRASGFKSWLDVAFWSNLATQDAIIKLSETFATHREAAAKAERDRIVAWLRDKADDHKPFGTTQGDPTGCVLSLAACAIEESQP